MRQVLIKFAAAIAVACMAFAPAAVAHADSTTMVVKGEVDTFTFDFPCIANTDNPYDVTTTSPNTSPT